MKNKTRLNKIVAAITKGSLSLVEGKKKWFCYTFEIQRLVWSRNFFDGWYIHVFYNDSHIGSIQLGDYEKTEIEAH